MQALLIDTVGFIRRLPHNLINAFRSTLEEICLADILLNVIDISSPDAEKQYETTLSVLRDLGAENIPMITVLNKVDLLEAGNAGTAAFVKKISGPGIGGPGTAGSVAGSAEVSALDGRGLPELCALIEKKLSGSSTRFRFPPERTDLAALLHRSGTVISEKYAESYIEVEARVDEKISGRLKEFQYND